MSSHTPHTAPAGLPQRSAHQSSEYAVTTAVEASDLDPRITRSVEYFDFYRHELSPEERVRFPPPPHWSRFARGAAPPTAALKKLHADPCARRRLLSRINTSVLADDDADGDVLPPNKLIVPDAQISATHARRLRYRAQVYEDQAPPTRAPSASTDAADDEDQSLLKAEVKALTLPTPPTLSLDGAISTLQRFARRICTTSYAQRALAARHFCSIVRRPENLTDIFGPEFELDKGSAAEPLDMQLTFRDTEHFAALLWEYEVRLHRDNYTSQILDPLDGLAPLRRGCLPLEEVQNIISHRERALCELRNNGLMPLNRFFGPEILSFSRTIDALGDRLKVGRRHHHHRDADTPTHHRHRCDPREPSNEAPAVATRSVATAVDSDALDIPAHCSGELNMDPNKSTWCRDFMEGGGFVDLDLLRSRGETGALVQPPKAKPLSAVCVICELDADSVVRCLCGNHVHRDCGVSIRGVIRCCQTCALAHWDQQS